jgi:hypothetical protein
MTSYSASRVPYRTGTLLCQFVEGWLLQVGPDSVFKVNAALWDIELAVQVKQFCEEESLAGSHPRQDNVLMR